VLRSLVVVVVVLEVFDFFLCLPLAEALGSGCLVLNAQLASIFSRKHKAAQEIKGFFCGDIR
jgi:hypothetical protein